MERKRAIGLATIAVVAMLILIWLLVPSAEDRIRKRIEATAKALEMEDTPGVLSIVNWDRFEDPWGHTVGDIEQALDGIFQDIEDIRVAMEKPRIVLEEGEKHARVTIRFIITGKYEGQLGFIVGSMNEQAMARFNMEKDAEFGWRIVEVTTAVLPGAI